MAIRGIFERPPGSRTWWISYCDSEGIRHREKVGRRSAALDSLARRRMEVKNGRFIPPKKGARLTFRELSQAAMARKKLRLAPLSYETDTIRLNQLLPLIGNVPADQLTPARAEETLASLIRERGISKSTANRYHALMSSIYKFAVDAGKLSFNPLSKAERFKENPSRVRWLKPEEEASLREAILDPDDQEVTKEQCMAHLEEFNLALHTGMRRGEQFFLEWKNVDLNRGNLKVTGKTGQRHIVANRSALSALRFLAIGRAKEKYVSPDATDEAKRDSRRWLEEALEKAGIDDFHWHDIRHTFASRLVMRGVDIRTVQELLGHKSIVQTMKYSHLAQDHRQSAVEKMNEEVPA
jgi:site-specific recombinase XerD